MNFVAKVVKNYEKADKNHAKICETCKNGRKKAKNHLSEDENLHISIIFVKCLLTHPYKKPHPIHKELGEG